MLLHFATSSYEIQKSFVMKKMKYLHENILISKFCWNHIRIFKSWKY